MDKAKCKQCGWTGNEDELVSTSVSISFVHCPQCGSDNTVTETEDESAFEEAAQQMRAADLGERAHQYDPCMYCGVAHDDVAVGDCPRR